MPAINTTKGIAPGKIFYHVYGTMIIKGKVNPKENLEDYLEKLIVTSFPKNWHYSTNSRSDSLFFDVLRVSKRDGSTYRSGNSVRDCGIGSKYNLNRIFATKIEALEFVSQCLMGHFFDKDDQAVYDNSRYDTDEGYFFNF